MPIPTFQFTGGRTLEEVNDQVSRLYKEISYILEGNIDADNIRAKSITADQIETGSLVVGDIPDRSIKGIKIDFNTILGENIGFTTITGGNIATGTITANKLNVGQLSAITADCGYLTAGLIEGVQIQTSGSGERIVLYQDELKVYDRNGIQQFRLTPYSTTSTNGVALDFASGSAAIWKAGSDFRFQTKDGSDIWLEPSNLGYVRMPFNRVYDINGGGILTNYFALKSHTHAISDITNLQTTLDAKASSTHTHAISDVTDLQTTLNGKASTTHSHAISDVTNLQTTLDAKASKNVATSGKTVSITGFGHNHGLADNTRLAVVNTSNQIVGSVVFRQLPDQTVTETTPHTHTQN